MKKILSTNTSLRSSTSDLTLPNGKMQVKRPEFFAGATRAAVAAAAAAAAARHGSSLSDEARPWLRFNANDWFS